MARSMAREAPVNPLQERNLLSAQAVSRWAGLPIGWVQAVPELAGSCETAGQTLLALLECGQAQAEFHYGARSFGLDLGAGAMGLFTPGGHADVSHWRCNGVRRIMLQFDHASLADPVLSDQLARMPLKPELEFHDEGLAAVLRAMVREVAEGCPSGALFAESLSLGVAMRLQQRAARRHAPARERGRLSVTQVRHVQDLVRARLAQAVSIGDLAQAAGFSRTQFVRLFKNTFACTPYQYVLDMRLQRARELVLSGETPLVGIAEEVGFSSQSHMTTAFVRAFGVTPGELRRTRLG